MAPFLHTTGIGFTWQVDVHLAVRSGRRLRIFLVALGLLAIGIAYGLRPADELEGVMRLKPRVLERHDRGVALEFVASYDEVLAAMPGRKAVTVDTADVWLPSGRRVVVVALPKELVQAEKTAYNLVRADSPGTTLRQDDLPVACTAVLFDDDRPWHLRTWSTVKYRLGL